MSARWRAAARPPLLSRRLRLLSLSFGVPVAVSLLVHAASASDPPAGAQRLDQAAARRAGLAIELLQHPELPVPLLEVRRADEDAATEAEPPGAGALLAVAADGSVAAVAERIGPDPTTLVLAWADGSQLRVPLDGLVAASFAPDGSWLAVVDGRGAVWRLAASDGAMQRVADGPFVGHPIVELDGSLLVLAVPSVEAPFQSSLVRLDSVSGTFARVSEEELVYAAQRLFDGSMALVVHRPTGTQVQRLTDRGSQLIADLGPGAVNVSTSADARVIAWESNGQVIVLEGRGRPRSLAAGGGPRISADGSAVLIRRDGRDVLVALDGNVVAELSGEAAMLRCEECRS